jgi:tetratricopeptide (TPR) repeat protein/TolB-like protein
MTRHRARLLAATLLVSIASPAAAAAQAVAGSRVLVLPFAAQADQSARGGAGGTLWLGEAAALLLTDGLADLGLVTLGRDERVSAFDHLRLPMRATLTRATMVRVGELVGASEVVFGEIRLAESARLTVRVRMVQLGPGRQLPDLADEAGLDGIFALFDRLSVRVAAAMGQPKPVVAPSLPRLPLEAFEAYVKGLVAATPATAQRFLETAMALAPRDPRILLALWRTYAEQDEHEKALAVANAVAADSPLARKARLAVALSLVELRRFDGAHKELMALAKQRAAPGLSNALGIVQLRRGVLAGPESATAYFDRAVAARPDDTTFLFNLGYAYALAKEAPTALQWLRETVRFDAAHGDAHLVMSSLLAGSGRQIEAQRELDLAKLLGTSVETATLTLGPAIPQGLERLATDLDVDSPVRLEAAVGNPSQRDQRQVALYHLERGRRLFEERRDRDAVNELRRAAYLAPYEEEPHRLLGQLYQRGGRLTEAIDELTVALWARETAAGRIALGTALLENGDRDGARREAERALVLQPSSTEAKDLLKRIGGGPIAAVMVPSPWLAEARARRRRINT